MKLKLLLISLLMLILPASVHARGVIFYQNGPECSKVIDLPNDPDFSIVADSGNTYHANLGVMYKQFSIFWIPLVTYGEKEYVYFTKDVEGVDYLYCNLDSDDISNLQYLYNIPAEPKLPFWVRWGGKLLFLALLGLIIFAKTLSKN